MSQLGPQADLGSKEESAKGENTKEQETKKQTPENSQQSTNSSKPEKKPKKKILEFLVKTPVPPGVQKVPYSFEIVHITLETDEDEK